MNIARFLFMLIFDGNDWYAVINWLVASIGTFFLFRKCGQKTWKAFIPFYRYYAISECAGCEHEGASVYITAFLISLGNAIDNSFPDDWYFHNVVFMAVGAVVFVYIIVAARLYLNLMHVFGEKKSWVLLWIPFEGLCSLYFGLSKKRNPGLKVSDFQETVDTYFTGGNAQVLSEGLTVNLKARTVRDNIFKKKYLLRDIHLYIKPGRMVLLLGGSGAGKTTFINAVNGYEKADAQVMLNGRDMYKEYGTMKYDVGMVPQLDLMRGNDTVYRTLLDASSLRLPSYFDIQERKQRVEDVMTIFGLTPVKSSLLEKLSGGQRKRVSIAMEFISNPTLFILDEPDSGLDGVMARELMKSLRDIADQGKIVMVITHTPDRVIDYFDDVIVLAKDKNRTGRLAYFGTVNKARQFFGKKSMEEILKSINRVEEGGEGRADHYIEKFAEAGNGTEH